MVPRDENECSRTLTDADVQAITTELRTQLVKEFYSNLGRGVWSLVWKAIIIALVALAAVGAADKVKDML